MASVGVDEIPLNSNVTIDNLDGTHTTGILKDKTGILTTTLAGSLSTTQFEGKDGVTTLEAMTDSNIVTKNISDVLTWDGTNWIAVSIAPKGGTTLNRPVDPELYTVYWDTDINTAAGGSITCVDNTTGANVWKNTSGVVV